MSENAEVEVSNIPAPQRLISIAKVCHEANKAWCEANYDFSQQSWDQAEQWQRDSAINGVHFAIDNPDAPDSAQHDAWCHDKVSNGWVYGTVKDGVAKTHPCLVDFHELPLFQQQKDKLFRAIVKSLSV